MRLYYMPTAVYEAIDKTHRHHARDAFNYLEKKYKLYSTVGPSFVGKIPFEVGDEKLLTMFLLEWAQ